MELRHFLLLLLLAAGSTAAAQEPVEIGKKYSLYSGILKEERTFTIYLPQDYNDARFPSARYPVIYLLDGESNFHSFTGLQQPLSKGFYVYMPQAIVVGIVNTDRTRDLTPEQAPGKKAQQGQRSFPNGGGNASFTAFLEKELRAYIDSHYRTSGYNILNGHSFGGLTAVNILLHHTSLFNAYVIIDPSLWWDDFRMLEKADSIFRHKDFRHTSIFVAMANKEVTEQDTTTDMQRSITAFHTLLKQCRPRNLDWQFKYYENEDHGTVSIPAEYDGLRFLFREHIVNVKAAAEDPGIVQEHFSRLSRRLGHPFHPSASWLDWMGDYCRKMKKPQQAIAFYKEAVRIYPGCTYAAEKLAEAQKGW